MKKLIVVLLLLFVAVAIAGRVLSSDYGVTRSIVINAPPAKIHEYVGELKNWDAWTPWKNKDEGGDETIVTTYGDKTTGVGAHSSWTGKKGDGEMTFTHCDPELGVAFDMAFIDKGQRYPSTSWIKYKPVSGGTEVTWGMEGSMNMPPVGGFLKLGPLIVPFMKREIGTMFETGLKKLKKLSEAGK